MSQKRNPLTLTPGHQLAPGEYQPVQPNPSGMRIAWILFGISVFVGAYMLYFRFVLPLLYWISIGILLMVALAISFSHWLEQRTAIVLSESGVGFRSPLRKVDLSWDEVDELWCGAIRGGWRYVVSGGNVAFRFQSLIAIRSGTGRTVRSGYPEGRGLAQTLVHRAGLKINEEQEGIIIYRRIT